MSDLPTSASRAGGRAGGRRKATRTPLTSRLVTRSRTRGGRIGVGLATTAVLAVVGGAVVGATGMGDPVPALTSAGADVDADAAASSGGGTSAEGATSTSDASDVASDREETEVSRSAARPQAAASALNAAKKKQADASARAKGKVAVETASMQDRDPREIAKAMLGDFGFGQDQFSCLNDLWVGESNWRWNADNPTSSAYGIPQALPGSKMASAGADWETNPATQIKWGLGYIQDRFGDPCSALSFKQGNGWY